MVEAKFKVGDKVKIIKTGCGFPPAEVGNIVTITAIGIYNSDIGYKVNPKLGNTLSGMFDGFNGQSSFELVAHSTTKPQPVEKHVIVQDNCGNFVSFENSYNEAETKAKTSSNNVTIYKMIEIAKVSNERIVKKVKPTKK